jgi:hypothetical protein
VSGNGECEARGDRVAFRDGDDVCEPERLAAR